MTACWPLVTKRDKNNTETRTKRSTFSHSLHFSILVAPPISTLNKRTQSRWSFRRKRGKYWQIIREEWIKEAFTFKEDVLWQINKTCGLWIGLYYELRYYSSQLKWHCHSRGSKRNSCLLIFLLIRKKFIWTEMCMRIYIFDTVACKHMLLLIFCNSALLGALSSQGYAQDSLSIFLLKVTLERNPNPLFRRIVTFLDDRKRLNSFSGWVCDICTYFITMWFSMRFLNFLFSLQFDCSYCSFVLDLCN